VGGGGADVESRGYGVTVSSYVCVYVDLMIINLTDHQQRATHRTQRVSTNNVMPPKKKQKLDIPIPALDGLGEDATTVRDALLSFRQQDARELLLSLMSCYGIPHLKLPPGPTFSSASWMQVCSDFGLSEDKGLLQLALFDLPDLCLPPSIHNRMLTAAMRAMDVYQEPQSHRTAEASNVRLFEAVSKVFNLLHDIANASQWHVPLCQLFRGRIIDKPEQRMPGTNLTSGGRVEHELFVLNQGIILLVYELKLIIHGVVGQEEAAQVFLEMHGIISCLFNAPHLF